MMFPVNLVFNGTEERRWGREYGRCYSHDDEAMAIYDTFAETVIETITGYTLPVITLPKETPRDAVCKVFENVNTGGVSLTVFELVTASYAIYEFDLRKDWKECRKYIRGENEDVKNTDVFDEIDETAYLTTVTLYTSYINKIAGKSGMVSCKKKDVLSLPYDDYKKNRDAVLKGYKIAREFLLKY